MRDEFVGFLRHADLMLTQAADAVKDDWETGEAMLSPQRIVFSGTSAGRPPRSQKSVKTLPSSRTCAALGYTAS